MNWTEILGFVTGAACVWLTVKQNIWNWPIGIANSAFWVILFWGSKLYFDSGLQVVYILLALVGWYWWLYGGPRKNELPVTRTTTRTALTLLVIGVLAIGGIWWLEASTLHSALPFWDASTTVVSLIAQYMLTRKYFGNWFLWIAVDVAYVGMYATQHLYLTAALQPLFIVMCLFGIRDWRRSMNEDPAIAANPALEVVT